MSQSKQNNTKEPIGEKLRRHTMDIMIISTAACLLFCLIKYKKTSQKNVESGIKHEIKSVTDVKQVNAINFSDSVKHKIR